MNNSIVSRVLVALPLYLALGVDPAEAAHCFCRFLVNNVQVQETAKGGYIQGLQADKCRDYCRGQYDANKSFIATLLPDACGPVQVKAFAAIGTAKFKEVRSGTVELPSCAPPDPDPVNQYAVKFVCGNPGSAGVLSPGLYFTAINLHNPTTGQLPFRTKLAVALPGTEGPITSWIDDELAPDGAKELDCPEILRRTATNPGGFVKGFAVIESSELSDELDVVAVYSANDDNKVKTLHTERVPKRQVLPAPRCEDLRIRGVSGANWTIIQDPDPATQEPRPATVESNPPSAWQPGPWITPGSTRSGNYIYRFTFCLCPDFDRNNASLSFVLRTDNQSVVTLNGNQIGSTTANSFSDPNPPPISTTSFFRGGQNVLDVVVTNGVDVTGLALTGTLAVAAGRCP